MVAAALYQYLGPTAYSRFRNFWPRITIYVHDEIWQMIFNDDDIMEYVVSYNGNLML